MSNLIVVVAGVPVLAAGLKETGLFADVLAAETTGELRQIITSPALKGVGKSDVVFLFGDTLKDDIGLPLVTLTQKLTGAGWKILIVALSPHAAEITRANPAAKLLPVPLTLNVALGSIRGLGWTWITPAENGFEELDLTGAKRAPAAAFNTPPAAPKKEAAPVAAPRMGGWATPIIDEPKAPAAKAPAAKAQPQQRKAEAPAFAASPEVPSFSKSPMSSQDSVPAPRAGGWNSPPPAPAEEGWGQAPINTPPAVGWGAPVAEPTPAWGAPAEEPTPAWGAPVAEPTPAWGAPVAEPTPAWGAPAPEQGGWDSAPARRSLTGTMPEAQPAWGADPSAPPVRRALSGLNDVDDGSYKSPFGASTSLEAEAGWQAAQDGGPVARPGGYQAEHAQPARRGMVITIAVSKGGTGKSSLTLNLAVFLALRLRGEGKTVCIIDTNFQQADTGKYLNLYHPNIMAVANDPTLLTRDRISQSLIHKTEFNVSALLGPATSDDGNPQWITPRLYNDILDLLVEKYDYIFIDTPVAEKFHSMFMEFALPRADFIIVPVQPNNATLHNTDNWLRQAVTAPRHANGANVPREKIGIVLNRAKDNIGCSEDDVRANLANWNFLGSVPETDEWQKANNVYDIVATYNFAELDEAFAQILFEATGEQALLASFRQHETVKSGLGAKLKNLLLGKK